MLTEWLGSTGDMTRESLDIILKIWENNGPFEYKGKVLEHRSDRYHVR